MKRTVLESDDKKRVARIYHSGRVTLQFFYETTFGPNSGGGEKNFSSEEEAFAWAENWILEKTL